MQQLEREKAFLALLVKAARPQERMPGSPWFQPHEHQEKEVLENRLNSWREKVCGPNQQLFWQLLEKRGLEIGQIRSWLFEGKVSSLDGIPAWADCIWRILKNPEYKRHRLGIIPLADVTDELTLKILFQESTQENWPYQEAFEPFIDVLFVSLHEKVLELGLNIDSNVIHKWICDFLIQANITCAKVLMAPSPKSPGSEKALTHYEIYFEEDRNSIDGWFQLLAEFPALCRALGVLLKNWWDTAFEFFERYKEDRNLFWERFGILGEDLALSDVDIGLGDRHNGGRSVCCLTFSDGSKLLYKPKDLSIVSWFMNLLHECNKRGLSPPLHVRAVLAPNKFYGWEEYVPNLPCRDKDDADTFFRRVGMYGKLLQLLEGRDFTADNIRTCQGHPVLVDLEMLLAPRSKFHPATADSHRRIKTLMNESSHETGLFSVKVPGDIGKKALDFGILGQEEESTVPFKLPSVEGFGQKDARIIQDYLPIEAKNPVRYADGSWVSPELFFDSVLTGYQSMGRFLMQEGKALFEESFLLEQLGATDVRFLFRDSRFYWRFFLQSLDPENLRDGFKREIFVEKLWKAFLVSNTPVAVIEHEIAALYDFDIPLFLAEPGSASLKFPGGISIEGFFEGNAIERVKKRLEQLTEPQLTYEMAWVRSALFVAKPNYVRTSDAPAISFSGGNSEPDFLNSAIAIGDLLLEHSFLTQDSGLVWVGLNYVPTRDYWELTKLGPSLLTGTAGIAVYFIELYRQTHLARFKTAANQIMLSLCKRLSRALQLWTMPFFRQPGQDAMHAYCGGYWGFGSYLLPLVQGRDLLEDPTPLEALHEPLTTFPWGALLDHVSGDWVTGVTSLVMILEQLKRFMPETFSELQSVGSSDDFDGVLTREPVFRVAGGYAEMLPDLHWAGILAKGVLQGSHRLIAPADGVLVGERDAFDDFSMESTGNILAMLALPHKPMQHKCLQDYLESCIKQMPQLPKGRSLLDMAEIYQTAYESLGNQTYLEARNRCLTQFQQTRRVKGTWLNPSYAADHHALSIISGTPAIGYLMLRANQQKKLGSPRLLGFSE